MLVGQKCFYWREAAGTGPRIRWKACCTLHLLPPWPSLPNSTMRAISRTHRVPLPGRADPRLRDLYTFARITLASTPLPHEAGSDSEQLDDEFCVNPDSADPLCGAEASNRKALVELGYHEAEGFNQAFWGPVGGLSSKYSSTRVVTLGDGAPTGRVAREPRLGRSPAHSSLPHARWLSTNRVLGGRAKDSDPAPLNGL